MGITLRPLSKTFSIKLVSYLLRSWSVYIFLFFSETNHIHAHRQFLFYSGIIGNAIQILQISIIFREPRKGMFMTEAMDEREASKIKGKSVKPSLSSSHQTSDGLTTRSKSGPYLKESCIICQVPGGSVSKVKLEQLESTCSWCQRNCRINNCLGG